MQYIADVPDGDGLTSDDIRYKLHEEITRRPRYFRELMEKGSYSGYSYAFVWNTKEMHKVLKGFSGDYYIAETVPRKFHHKFGVIMEKYNINQTRIHKIAD